MAAASPPAFSAALVGPGNGSPEAADALIGGQYAVEIGQPLPGAAGGQPAFVALDRRAAARRGLMAVQVRPNAPARAQAISALMSHPIPDLLTPLAHGVAPGVAGRPAAFVISQTPPGAALLGPGAQAMAPWPEADLLELVLRPAAAALQALHARHVTHRAIRLDNLFRVAVRRPVLLGMAWAAPPASLQPAIYEPPYVAMCAASARGEGAGADDVYALGVVLLALALGRPPMDGLDDGAVIRRKLDLGSFAALVGGERLPPVIADLLYGMLAEDPEHRPTPALLADPGAARSRRVAARPPRRGQRGLDVARNAQGEPVLVWTARSLAHALAVEPHSGLRLLRSGAVDQWLRRGLADSVMAAKIEEALRSRAADAGGDEARADGLLLLRAVTLLDPLAPVCWRGAVLWPGGLGTALAACPPGSRSADASGSASVEMLLSDLIASEAIAVWGAMRPLRCDAAQLRQDAHEQRMVLRMRGWSGGLPRLRYLLNPLLACNSPALEAQIVIRLGELLPALEAAARSGGAQTLPIDRDIAGFLAARHDTSVENDLSGLGDAQAAEVTALLHLRLLARLQARLSAPPLPRLAAWLCGHLTPGLAVWHNRQRRLQAAQALTSLSEAGQLSAMLALLDDRAALAADQRELEGALNEVRHIDAQLAALQAGEPARSETARRICREVVSAIAAMSLAAAAIAAVMP